MSRPAGSTSGRVAARVAENEAPSITAMTSRAQSAANGIRDNAIMAAIAARLRFRAIITVRRGNRPATSASSGPPMTWGRQLIAYTSAVRNADLVCS